MSIPNNVYPKDYWGPLGKEKCEECGDDLLEDVNTYLYQDRIYCEYCYLDLLHEEKYKEEEEDV